MSSNPKEQAQEQAPRTHNDYLRGCIAHVKERLTGTAEAAASKVKALLAEKSAQAQATADRQLAERAKAQREQRERDERDLLEDELGDVVGQAFAHDPANADHAARIFDQGQSYVSALFGSVSAWCEANNYLYTGSNPFIRGFVDGVRGAVKRLS